MVKLSEEAKKLIGEIHPALVATASKDGKPNVSAKGTLWVVDDETVAFADVASPRTVANIRENPQVSIICLDATSRKSCRIWGTAEILNSGSLFDEMADKLAARNMKVNNVVKVNVAEVQTS
jgi:predicted pyridoxine 5'-phosphate oxidase superfamily flavin-nucleotide-binding protein